MIDQFALNVLGVLIAMVAAVAAWKSASAASQAAQVTRDTSVAQLMAGLMAEYSSEKMLGAMITLRRFQSEHGIEFAAKFRQKRQSDYDTVAFVDKARRRVSHYFQRVVEIYDLGFLNRSSLERLATKGQIEFFLEVIEPLEEAITTDYDDRAFRFLGKMHGLDRFPPRMANP